MEFLSQPTPLWLTLVVLFYLVAIHRWAKGALRLFAIDGLRAAAHLEFIRNKLGGTEADIQRVMQS